VSARAPQGLSELSAPARALAELVPGVYLGKNEVVEGRPLLVLLEVLAGPLAELERAIDQLHDDHFVERASADVLPLLAELVGARLLVDDPRTTRAVVARSLHWRRRKGSLRTLEDVLSLTSGWATEVDEGFRSLLVTQDLAHLVPWRGRDAVLWDPVALADPLSRRAPVTVVPRHPGETGLVAREQDESVEDALLRLGRADAGRPAVSPRTVDFLGWAQPDRAVIRSSRLVSVELDEVELVGRRPVPHRDDPDVAYLGFHLDPLGRDLPLAGHVGVERPEAAGGLTAAHEPDEDPPAEETRRGLLTPTALAFDGDGAERADDLSVFVDDVRLVGRDGAPAAGEILAFEPVGPEPLLRFGDADRPSPADEWELALVALDGDEDPVLVSTLARRGGHDPETVTAAANLERAGASVAVRVGRQATGTGYRRRGDGTWETVTIGEPRGLPLTNAVLVDAGGRLVARLESRPQGGAQLAVWRPDSAASRWTTRVVHLEALADEDQPDLDAAKDGASLSAIGVDGGFVFVGPVAGAGVLGVWRVDDPLAAPVTPQRIDGGGPRRPPARMAPILCVHEGRLLVFGGEQDGSIAGDLWSVALAGADAGRWVPHRVRNRQRRVGGHLISTPDGVVLVGGASRFGELDSTEWRADLARSRPAWEALPPLPIEPGRAGTAWARADGDAVEVLAWADRAWPRHMRWEPATGRWEQGRPERRGPNPPAEGEGLFAGEEFLVVGPPPLPPSEVVFRQGGRGRVAFLPAVDIDRDEDGQQFSVRDDGSTDRRFPPGEEARPSLRLGAGRDAPTGHRTAPAERVSAPGRLAWRPLRFRQLSLGAWDQPFALDLDDVVGVDPRLGRVLVRRELAGGRVSASFLVGRAAAIGAGFTPPTRALPAAWAEPPDPEDPGRFAAPIPPGDPATAWVSPRRAALRADDDVPIAATLGQAVGAGTGAVSVGTLGSPVLPPDLLTIAQSAVASIWPADTGSLPHVEEEDAVSLSLHERLALDRDGPAIETEDPNLGPTWFLAGLSLAGAVELVVAAGDLDMRWCTVAAPGEIALRVAGAGHQPPLLRHSIPRTRVRVRLYGCQLGRVELPPWVELTAAGCTFDADDPDLAAISAAGASLRLRHCTVNGRTEAGRIMATSCALKGPVTCDRPDQSWARYCLLPPGGRPPLLYRSLVHHVSFASIDPTSPYHLALADNNGQAALTAGERGLTPGAHADRAQRLLELTARTEDFLPLALVPHHLDRTADDLHRRDRRTA
jgi:hypothetical protein